MTDAFKREWRAHYQRLGERLVGATYDEAQRHCELLGLAALERAWVLEGLAGHHRKTHQEAS